MLRILSIEGANAWQIYLLSPLEFVVIWVGKNSKMAAEAFLSCMVPVGVNNGLAHNILKKMLQKHEGWW